MISFRYHVVSLTAVFLALAVGVIAGTTVVPKPLITSLRSQVDNITESNRDLRARTEGQEQQIAMWERFGEDTFASQIANDLRGVRVARVLIGVDGDLVKQIDQTLRTAGAAAGGTLVLEQRWALRDERARIALGTVLAVPTRDAGELWREAGTRLGDRLRNGADPRTDTDLLRLLENEDFVRIEDVPRGRFPARNTVVLVVTGGDRQIAPPADPFLNTLVPRLAGARAVVAEPLGAREHDVEDLRAVVEIRDSVGTIDHVDTALGRYGMVAALVRAARGGAPLHLGVGERADRLVPQETRAARRPVRTPTPAPSRS